MLDSLQFPRIHFFVADVQLGEFAARLCQRVEVRRERDVRHHVQQRLQQLRWERGKRLRDEHRDERRQLRRVRAGVQQSERRVEELQTICEQVMA